MIKQIKKRFLESSFLKVLSLIKNNPNIYLYTIAFDFLFLTLILLIGKYLGSLIPQDPDQIMALFKTQTNLLIFVFLYTVVYYLFIMFIYSTVKLTMLNLIKSLYEKNKFSLNRLGKFYLLNILIFLIFTLIGLILFAIFALILTREFLIYIVVIVLIPLIFFLYSIINISHIFFIKTDEKGIIKKSFKLSFNKINKYGMFIMWDIAFIAIYLLFYNIIHLIFRFFIFSNQQMLTSYGGLYLIIFNIFSLIVFYLIIAFNRIYFYKRIGKNVL